MTETRPCTCAPDERPFPCQHQYALGLCRKAENRAQTARIAELEAALAAERKRREAHAVVTWFAGVMEECLRDNDHKDGWSHCSQRFLLTRLFEEAFELKAAIESGALPVEIEREAADVANFAMMIADVCGGDGQRTHDEKKPT